MTLSFAYDITMYKFWHKNLGVAMVIGIDIDKVISDFDEGVFKDYIKEAQKLKKYFDEKLGYNLYKLFPDILKEEK